jgi:hypothetical protein
MPLVYRKNPQKETGTHNFALGHGGGAARAIPVRSAALQAVQGRADEGMLT